jgi:type II secretion system protein H
VRLITTHFSGETNAAGFLPPLLTKRGEGRGEEVDCSFPSASYRAFTLIELMLVMAVMLIVVSIGLPSLKNFFRGRNLDSEARRFLSMTRYGQSRAVSEGMPVVLWIDSKQHAYGLQIQAGYTDSDSHALQYNLDRDLQVEVQVNRSSALTVSNLWTQTAQSIGPLPTIRFLPDGSIAETSPERIVIHGAEKNDAIWIAESTNRLNYEIQANNQR